MVMASTYRTNDPVQHNPSIRAREAGHRRHLWIRISEPRGEGRDPCQQELDSAGACRLVQAFRDNRRQASTTS